MDLLDLIIILALVSLAARGLGAGFFRQTGSLGGFIIGLMLGAALAPAISQLVGSGGLRPLIGILLVFTIASLVSGLGEWLGLKLARGLHRLRLSAADEVAGAGLGVIVGLVAVWLVSTMFIRVPLPWLQSQLAGSAIIRTLDQALPPAPEVLARFERIIAPNGFPRVFTGLEPAPAAPVTGPDAPAVNAAAAAGRAATVQIVGVGCGGELEGSGFVAGPDLVATNAHVVAGIDSPIVIDAAGRHRAQVVVFNPELDFAVLRTTRLAAAPLRLGPATAPRGTVGAALGYPGGGPFSVSPAAILSRQRALGRDIYDSGLVRRDIYELQAVVRPGNSGGPFVTPDGTVIGVIFATSTTNDSIGYALTAAEVLPDLQRAATSAPTGTGPCLAE